MHHAEAVGDECAIVADQFGQLPGERQPLGVVLAGFARIEPDVLQQQDIAVGQALRPCQRIGPDHVAR